MRRSIMLNRIKDSHSSKSNQRIYGFLKENSVGVLATVDPNNNPHATTVYYSMDENFNVFFTTKHDTKKQDNLKHNNHVMLVVYDAFSQTTVQVTGVAQAVTDDVVVSSETFRNTVRAAIRTSESGVPPISKLYAGSYVAYCIKPVQIRMAIFLRPDPGGYDMYETIDFQP